MPDKEPEDFDEEELIRSEFESMVSGLSLDESAPTTYLDDLDRIETVGFIAPNPPKQSARSLFESVKRAVKRWFYHGYHEDDGAKL